MLAVGQRIDRYVIEGKIGTGGVATVYRVRHLTLGTLHALKVLTRAAQDVRVRLVQEGRVQAAMDHPNVLQVTDVLDVDGAPGLLMRFVEGTTLEHWLARYDPTLEEALALFRGICAGVAYAHLRGFVHRDLKPGNVLLALTDGKVIPKVSDFGLARILQLGAMRSEIGATMGTPGYMAPEQSKDASTVDRRADLWSVGCILYRLTVGAEPFPGDDIHETLRAVEAGDYQSSRRLRPALPERVHAAIERLLTVDAARRPHDAALVLSFVDGETDVLAAADEGAPLPRPVRVVTTRPSVLQGTDGVHVARDLADENSSRVATIAPHLRTPAHWLEAGIGPPPLQSSVTLSPVPEDRPEEEPPPLVPQPGSGVDRRAVIGVAALGGIVAGGLTLVVAVALTAVFVAGRMETRVEVARPAAIASPTEEPAPVQPPTGVEAAKRSAPPPPVPRGGTAVTFTGAEHLWLEPIDGGAPVRDLGAVPGGRYRIMAVFRETSEVVPAGEIVIGTSGRSLAITCDAELLRCRARR
jgi:serine/threonine-protein kinase